MKKKIFFCVLIFLITGELMLRFDNRFKFFAANQVVAIKTGFEDTPEFDMVKKNAINTNGNNLRVLVLGDSYIFGGGIDFKDNFSQQLKKLLKNANTKYDDVYVLDLANPMSNCPDYHQTYFQFADKFKPDVVVLGFNYNDVEGNQDRKSVTETAGDFSITKVVPEERKGFKQQVFSMLFNSMLIQRALHNVIYELKAFGYITPNSEFDKNMKLYYQNSANWTKAKLLLKEMTDDCKKKNTPFIFLQFPEINLLEYPGLFTKADSSIHNFIAESPAVTYINGADIFKGDEPQQYMLSRYDGHPNGKAHIKIAKYIFDIIEKLPGKADSLKK